MSLPPGLPLGFTPRGSFFINPEEVRFGSLADILASPRHVRFTPITDVERHIQVSIWLSIYE
jgi:hypothetical protein